MLADNTLTAIGKHTELYARAARFQGRPRERMVALGEADELFLRLYPDHYRALQVVRVASQLNQREQKSADRLTYCESRLLGYVSEVIHDGVLAGDLALSPQQRAGDMAFMIWAMAFGTIALMNSTVARMQLRVDDGRAVLRSAAELLFDGWGWQPLSSEWDYERTRARVREELFGAEWPTGSAA